MMLSISCLSLIIPASPSSIVYSNERVPMLKVGIKRKLKYFPIRKSVTTPTAKPGWERCRTLNIVSPSKPRFLSVPSEKSIKFIPRLKPK